jgi:short-subunit dehydrogenase
MLAIGEDLRQRWGRIDIAVLNAGTYEPVTPETFAADLFREHLEVNFMGTVHCIEAVLQDMRKRQSGRIAVVASVTGYAALPKAEAYGATKAALISMADSLRADLATDGVKVTVIAPGFVRTPLTVQNEFAMPFLIEPERAARIVAEGLERGKDEIAFPLRMAFAMKGLGMLPGPIARRYVAGVARRRRDEGT